MNKHHLGRAVRTALELSDEERIKRVRSPRWIGYPTAKRILDRLEDLLTYPRTHRMPGLLLVGETNNGKTMIINRFRQLHPAHDNPEAEAITLPVLIVQAPPTPSEGRLYDKLRVGLDRIEGFSGADTHDGNLQIDYPPDKSVIFERLNILQRRTLLHALDRLLQNWPDNFIEFCQANHLASHFLVGDNQKDLPFWYLRVVREHLNKSAHKVSDEEIISIVNYVRNGGDQPTTQELRPFISPGVCTRARSARLIKRKEYLGLCPHCHATKQQFKSGLSSHRTQQFRYQHDYQTGRTRPRFSPPSFQHSKQDSRVASVES